MDFSAALVMLKQGNRMQRSGWNGKGMFVYLVVGSSFKVNREPLTRWHSAGDPVEYLPHIDMFTADKKYVPWLASQTDILADDWQIFMPISN